MQPVRIPRRPYGGKSADQRRSERRRLIETAGLQIWQEHGWAAVTMRGVCARAGLTDRYFYESFADRDALLAALWDRTRDEMLAFALGSIGSIRHRPPFEQLRTALTALIGNFTTNPARAQIIFGDHAGSAVLEQRRRDTIQQASDLMIKLARPYLRPDIDEVAFRVNVLVGIGGFVELMGAWRSSVIKVPPTDMVEHLMGVGEALAPRFLVAAG